MSAEPALSCVDVTVRYGSTPTVDAVTLTVGAGEVLALLGPSGSGKSTLLNTIAGSVQPAAGEICIAGMRVAGAGRSLPPEKRPVGMVFQNYALWPHLTVLDTVAYPMRRAGRSRVEATAAARDLLRQLGISQLADRYPAQLSGGEQQRTGLARALARHASLFLLDEPTAHLDTHLRAAFAASVLDRQQQTGAAVVYATHDAGEALRIADRVALMVAGQLVQIGSPAQVYAEPVSTTAAALTGPYGTVTGRVTSVADDVIKVLVGDAVVGCSARSLASVGDQVQVLVRPDWVSPGGPLSGAVSEVAFHGPNTDYQLTGPDGTVPLTLPGPPRFDPGSAISWSVDHGVVIGPAADG